MATPTGPLDRLPEFRRACPEQSAPAKPQRTAADAVLLEYARRVSADVARIDALTARLQDPNLTLEAYQKATQGATVATRAAQAAATELMEHKTEGGAFWEWRRRAAQQATDRLQQVLSTWANQQINFAL